MKRAHLLLAAATRAAKKQNVGFKIACTGTPVENTLADLWCLFDYVQPGLLGALNDFGDRYRKPIEAKTEEEKARVEELRARIAPQILRRMKADVAKDLPRKIIFEGCRRLPMSSVQRNLYAQAVESFKKRGKERVQWHRNSLLRALNVLLAGGVVEREAARTRRTSFLGVADVLPVIANKANTACRIEPLAAHRLPHAPVAPTGFV